MKMMSNTWYAKLLGMSNSYRGRRRIYVNRYSPGFWPLDCIVPPCVEARTFSKVADNIGPTYSVRARPWLHKCQTVLLPTALTRVYWCTGGMDFCDYVFLVHLQKWSLGQ